MELTTSSVSWGRNLWRWAWHHVASWATKTHWRQIWAWTGTPIYRLTWNDQLLTENLRGGWGQTPYMSIDYESTRTDTLWAMLTGTWQWIYLTPWRQIWAGTEHQFTRLPEITYVWWGSLGKGGYNHANTPVRSGFGYLIFFRFSVTPVLVSYQSLWIKSTVSMQLRNMQYYNIIILYHVLWNNPADPKAVRLLGRNAARHWTFIRAVEIPSHHAIPRNLTLWQSIPSSYGRHF